MSVFVDTSALYALVDPDDAMHDAATDALADLAGAATGLVTHDYVMLETTALVQRRLGMARTRLLHEDVLRAVSLRSVDSSVRDQAVATLLTSGQRDISLVDRVSFIAMRRWGLETAFAFDEDFTDQGFDLVPT